MWRVGAVAVAVLALAAPACAAANPAAEAPSVAPDHPLEPSEPFGRTTVTLRSPDGRTTTDVPVYDAFTRATRQRGLMFRESLPEGTGMVFRMPSDRSNGFWMKNTLIPLSIAYFDAAGTVVSVLDMEPCAADPCPSYPPNATYRGTLEVNQGFFAEVGLVEGWTVVVPEDLPAPS